MITRGLVATVLLAAALASPAAADGERDDFVEIGRIQAVGTSPVGTIQMSRTIGTGCPVTTDVATSPLLEGRVLVNVVTNDWIVDWYAEGTRSRVLPVKCAPTHYIETSMSDISVSCDPLWGDTTEPWWSANTGGWEYWSGVTFDVAYFRPGWCHRAASLVSYRVLLSYLDPKGEPVLYGCRLFTWTVTFVPRRVSDDPQRPRLDWFDIRPNGEQVCYAA